MVGLDNAGKTTILYQFLMNEVVHTSPTIGSNVEEIVWKNIHFLVWDLAGKLKLLFLEEWINNVEQMSHMPFRTNDTDSDVSFSRIN